jgi:predicted nuclease with TOPRIM domain
MLELARMARRVWPEDQKFQAQLRRIELEMHQLQEMSSKRRFRSLSQQRLQELKNNLENSRQMIIHSLETVPPPTDRFQ